jgi:hypothetical protein
MTRRLEKKKFGRVEMEVDADVQDEHEADPGSDRIAYDR